jgi:hypothetical protein
MPATVGQIFAGTTNPAATDQSATFSGADFLCSSPPRRLPPGDNYEIAGALYVEVVDTQDIGGLTVTTSYGVREIDLPIEVFDTSMVVRIPDELSRSGLNMSLCIATAYSDRPRGVRGRYGWSWGQPSGHPRPVLNAIQTVLNTLNLASIAAQLGALVAILPGALTFILTGNPTPLLIGGAQLLLPPP